MKKYTIVLLLFFFYKCEDMQSKPDTVFEYTYHENKRVASLEMSSDEYDSWITYDGFTNTEQRLNVINDIYNVFSDDCDFIFLILDEPSIPANLNYYVKLIGVSNSVSGLGLQNYDYSLDYGSDGKLKAVMQLTGLEYLKYGPALHELAHQWANHGLATHSVDSPGEELISYLYTGHWGFTGGSTPGQLGGFSQSSLIENGNNSYTVDSFGPFANGGNGLPFNELELYLMGMLDIQDLNNFDMFTDITAFTTNESTFDFTANQKTTYTPETLIALLGERSPSYDESQKEFNLLAIVITESSLTDEKWSKVDATAEWFSKSEDDGSSLYNFWEATNGLGSISISY